MTKHGILLSLCLLLLPSCARADAAKVPDTYCNPLDVIMADPFVLKHENAYYLYGTTVANYGFEVFSSPDLINWTYRGMVMRKSDDSWAQNRFWAPECFEHKGKFYFHYTATSAKRSLRVGLAVADTPVGPFKDIKTPWIDPGQAVIDSHVFRDVDGKLYLYYVIDCSENKFSEIRVCPLSDDLVPDLAKSQFVAKPSQEWEGTVWNEGPFVLRRGDMYYMMYSANGFMDPYYGMGYATAKSPMGPWTKYDGNPILQRNTEVGGPGHNSVIESPDGKELFAVYHTLQNPGFNAARQLAVDRLRFIPDGAGPAKMVIDGPTIIPQPLPSGAGPFVRGQSDDFSAARLDRRRWTIFNEDPKDWSLDGGRIVIHTRDGDVAEKRDDLENVFLQYAPHGDFDAVTRVKIEATKNYQHAFLCLWQDIDHFAKVVIVYSDEPRLEVGIEQAGKYESRLFPNPLGNDVYLRVARRGNLYTFSASRDGNRWTDLVADAPLEFKDLRVGLGAASPGPERANPPSVPAAFDFLHFRPKMGAAPN